MKVRILFCLLAVAAVATGCKKVVPASDENQPNDLIRLNSGVGNVVIGKADVTTPERTQEGFVAADEIGVIAVFSKKQTVTESEADEPNWGLEAVNRHFTNVKAIASAPVTPVVSGSFTNEFAWETNNAQYYPQGRNIFLYAYYPYHDGAATESTKGVKLKKATATAVSEPIERDSLVVTLQPETVTDQAQILTQPDVMVASHAKATAASPASISRVSPESDTRLVFRHLLSQLQFTIWKEKEVKGDTKFKSLKVYVPSTGNFAVGGQKDDVALAPIPMKDTKIDYEQFVVYTLTYAPAPMPYKGEEGAEPQVLMDRGAGYTPFMTFPLTLEQLKAGYIKIELTVDLGGSFGEKTFEIPSSAFTKPLMQGATNTINFTVNYVLVTVTASVTPWATNPETNEIPIE